MLGLISTIIVIFFYSYLHLTGHEGFENIQEQHIQTPATVGILAGGNIGSKGKDGFGSRMDISPVSNNLLANNPTPVVKETFSNVNESYSNIDKIHVEQSVSSKSSKSLPVITSNNHNPAPNENEGFSSKIKYSLLG